jgi:hypothetical protein
MIFQLLSEHLLIPYLLALLAFLWIIRPRRGGR